MLCDACDHGCEPGLFEIVPASRKPSLLTSPPASLGTTCSTSILLSRSFPRGTGSAQCASAPRLQPGKTASLPKRCAFADYPWIQYMCFARWKSLGIPLLGRTGNSWWWFARRIGIHALRVQGPRGQLQDALVLHRPGEVEGAYLILLSVLVLREEFRDEFFNSCVFFCHEMQPTTADVEAEFWRLVEHGSGAYLFRSSQRLQFMPCSFACLCCSFPSRCCFSSNSDDRLNELPPHPAALPVEAVCAPNLDTTKVGAPPLPHTPPAPPAPRSSPLHTLRRAPLTAPPHPSPAPQGVASPARPPAAPPSPPPTPPGTSSPSRAAAASTAPSSATPATTSRESPPPPSTSA